MISAEYLKGATTNPEISLQNPQILQEMSD